MFWNRKPKRFNVSISGEGQDVFYNDLPVGSIVMVDIPIRVNGGVVYTMRYDIKVHVS